ncbi:hypothetical protein AALA83_00680 [Oscillospiraceae bacterium 44-5]|uniref:hypothetical protein n=1 Tax=Lawsonibacter sp. JLR.KK007 TaxID=3114293 RepID=UPI002FEFF32C
MTDREKLYSGLSNAAWGYVFLTFDFNLNNVSVLPRFVGFYLLFSAIGKLSGERQNLNLLRPLCILLTGWSGLDWLLSWLGGDVEGHILFLDLLVTVVTLYFHFQFLTDMAALSECCQPEDDNLASRIRGHRTAFTLLITVFGLMADLTPVLPWEWWAGMIGFGALITCIVALMIMLDLFHLRKLIRSEEEGPRL